MPLDEVERLFQKFTKLSTKPTAGESSNGLDLAIAQKLVLKNMTGAARNDTKAFVLFRLHPILLSTGILAHSFDSSNNNYFCLARNSFGDFPEQFGFR